MQQERSETARERRTALYKSDQQQQQQVRRNCVVSGSILEVTSGSDDEMPECAVNVLRNYR